MPLPPPFPPSSRRTSRAIAAPPNVRPPSDQPPTPKGDLAKRGFETPLISQYEQIFQVLDADNDGMLTMEDIGAILPTASKDELSWVLHQFVPNQVSIMQDGPLKVDIVTFVRICEQRRTTEWADAYGFARDSIYEEIQSSKKDIDAIMKDRFWAQITPAEGLEMKNLLENRDEFVKIFTDVQSSDVIRKKAHPLSVKQSGISFWDGKGSPRKLTVASPSLEETKFPPPPPPERIGH